MKYIPAFAFVLLFIGCSITREVPDDRYEQPNPNYGYSDPFYSPGYDYSYRDRVYYDNSYSNSYGNSYGNRNRRRQYRSYNQPQYGYQQQPQYRVVQPRVERQPTAPAVVLQPGDKKYPDGTIKRSDGTILRPERNRN